MKKNASFVLVGFLVLLIMSPFYLSHSYANDGGVTMNIIGNDMQNPDIESWFDLDTSGQKGKEIDLSVVFHNLSDSPNTIEIETTNVITVQNGGLDYVIDKGTEYTGSLKDTALLKESIKNFPKELSFKPNDKKEVSFKVDVPDGPGQHLVGFAYSIVDDTDSEVDNTDGGVQVRQKMRYATPIVMTNTIEDSVDLDITSVDTEFDRGSPRILVGIDNNSVMMERASIEYRIINDADGSEVFSGKTNGFLMSPLTYIKFPITWDGDLEMGNYSIDITVLQENMDGDIRKVSDKFEVDIKDDELNVIEEDNNTKIVVVKNKVNWIPYLISFTSVAALIFILVKGRRQTKSDS